MKPQNFPWLVHYLMLWKAIIRSIMRTFAIANSLTQILEVDIRTNSDVVDD
jgi:hypothetical protein